MLYAIIILSILVVITSFVYWSIALWNEKQQKRLSMEYLEMMMSQRRKLFPWSGRGMSREQSLHLRQS